MEKPFYSVNFSAVHSDRPTDTKTFDLQRDAIAFAESQRFALVLRLAKGRFKVLINTFDGLTAGAGQWLDNIKKVWS